MARKTKEEAEKTYFALLESSALLFTRQGVANTTLHEIAKEAGLTRGAVYWHFQGKDDIIRALWETYSIQRIEPVHERMHRLNPATALADFQRITDDILELLINDKKLAQAMRIVLHNMEVTDNQSDLLSFMNDEKRRFEATLCHSFEIISENFCFRKGLNAEGCALSFMCFLQGLLAQHFDPQDKVDIATYGKTVMEIFFNGIIAD